MTGYYVRVARENRFLSLDIAELTDDELTVLFAAMDAEDARRWGRALAGWIRDHVRVEDTP